MFATVEFCTSKPHYLQVDSGYTWIWGFERVRRSAMQPFFLFRKDSSLLLSVLLSSSSSSFIITCWKILTVKERPLAHYATFSIYTLSLPKRLTYNGQMSKQASNRKKPPSAWGPESFPLQGDGSWSRSLGWRWTPGTGGASGHRPAWHPLGITASTPFTKNPHLHLSEAQQFRTR